LRNVSDESWRGNQNTYFTFNKVFFLNRAFYEIMWKNIAEWDRPRMTIWYMRIACWIPKPTNTHSQYVILVAFPLQQWLHECTSMLRLCVHLHVLLQHVKAIRDYLQIIHKSKVTKNKHWIIGGLYLNEFSFVELIGLYWGVNGVCICHALLLNLWQVGERKFFFFVPSILLILTVAVQVIVGKWTVCEEVCVLYWNSAKFWIPYYEQLLHDRSGIQKNYWFWKRIIFRNKMGL